MALNLPLIWTDHFYSQHAPARGIDEDDVESGRFDACEIEGGRYLVYSPKDDAIVVDNLSSRIAAVREAARLANGYHPSKAAVTLTVPIVGLTERQVEALIIHPEFFLDAVNTALKDQFASGEVGDDFFIQSHFAEHMIAMARCT